MMIADWTKFTEKQRACIMGYIRHGNKVRSYREAYDVSDPQSKVTLRNAQSFFKKPHVMAIVAQIQEEAIKRASIQLSEIVQGDTDRIVAEQKELEVMAIDATWVLTRAALLADFNIRKFMKISGGDAVYDFSEATDDDWYCIQEYTVEEIARGQNQDKYHIDKLKLKSYDKLRALELVGKHIDVQAFEEKTTVEHDLKNLAPVINLTLS